MNIFAGESFYICFHLQVSYVNCSWGYFIFLNSPSKNFYSEIVFYIAIFSVFMTKILFYYKLENTRVFFNFLKKPSCLSAKGFSPILLQHL
jgi:hypothetical protein